MNIGILIKKTKKGCLERSFGNDLEKNIMPSLGYAAKYRKYGHQ